MANIKRVEGKTGISYKITVTRGRDSSGKQIRHYKTWTPDPKMTARQMEKEAQRVAYEFERQLDLGYAADDRQQFKEYAEYVLDLKKREGCKRRTIENYTYLLSRIIPAIGHMKLADIRPQHLNAFYKELGEPSASRKDDKATACTDLVALVASTGLSKAAFASKAGIGTSTFADACKGNRVTLTTAEGIAKALGEDVDTLFMVERNNTTLTAKTILEHHRLISTILSQADKEMLVKYNAAAKASPPKAEHKTPNYFQVKELDQIQEALESVHIKWKTITHLLIMTGCRRGEIAGLKWSRVDFNNNKIYVDRALLYNPEEGIFEDTTKNDKARSIKLPKETMDLLRQYRRWYLELKLKNGDRWHDSDYMFVRNNGSPMQPDTITSWLSDFSERRGLPHINPHAFRHTNASVLIRSGQDIVSVSKRLGHTKVSTTTDIYAQFMEEADEEASENLANALLRKREE